MYKCMNPVYVLCKQFLMLHSCVHAEIQSVDLETCIF